VRRTPALLLTLAITSNIGMWLERMQIVFTSTHADYMPSAWGVTWPTVWDWAIYAGTLGVFAFLLLAFIRVAPLISLHDMRALVHKRGPGE
jgi:molybdopterin-containing oxidoreductase family membrane subunit